MIQVVELTKRYGGTLAVEALSFEVSRGEVVGFLGPNGAGKSTTLRMLCGFLAPSSGRVRVMGHDVQEDPLAVQRSLGYMPETCPLYPELRVVEYLGFRAALKGVAGKQKGVAVERAMRLSGVYDRRGSLIGHLSKGYRQRVGLADALVAAPPLLILDEPTSGLDPNQIREVRQLIRELKQEHTVLLSTHILAEVEMVCARALVLHRGKLVAQGTLEELKGLRRQSIGELLLEADDGAVLNVFPPELNAVAEPLQLEPLPDAANHGHAARWVVQLKQSEHGLAPLVAPLVARGVRVKEARMQQTRLEDVFAELTRTDSVLTEAEHGDAANQKEPTA